MPASPQDLTVLRELAKRFVEATARPVLNERRRLWRDHNSLVPTRPLIILRGGRAWGEVPQLQVVEVQDQRLRGIEHQLREGLWRLTLGDDYIVEPWVTVGAVRKQHGWGIDGKKHYSDDPRGSYKAEYPIVEEADIEKLVVPRHEIDEPATQEHYERVAEAVGDIVTVNLDRGPAWRVWSGDISTDLGRLRGIENFMLDMMDRPEWLHRLLAFLRDGVLKSHAEAEDADDWSRSNSENQSMAYARELADPAPNAFGTARKQLWVFVAAQEYTLVSPAMHDEFVFQYQKPIMEHFGLSAYGCCEDLTRKIDMLRSVKNLRRIAVTPRADVKACAEQIGTDYVISWRPNPAEMVCCGYNEDRIRKIVTEALNACRGLHVDICLKDIDTVENQPQRLGDWAKLVRGIVEEYA